ncbi:hypothetical protein [Dysosmobacter sp.]|uniref:hypothetical protein n=1 Tax=Dysosmobacter sp. TaxID=2591382 RepID=UPI003AF12018
MRKRVSMAVVCVFLISVLCINAEATGTTKVSLDDFEKQQEMSVRATGSFNMSVAP